MATKVLINDRYRHRGSPSVSINPKLARLLLYKEAYELMKKHYGNDFGFVQILTDEDRPKLFWLKPCEPGVLGGRKMDTTSPSSHTISIRALLTEIKLKPNGTLRFRVVWDKEEQAAQIDISEPEKQTSQSDV